jgi:hypothetical protein
MVPPRGKVRKPSYAEASEGEQYAVDGKHQKENSRQKRTVIEHPLSRKAAELAGMSKTEFFEVCGRYRVSAFNYPDEEVKEEIRKDFETVKIFSRE